MKSKKIKLMSVITASALLLSGCSSILDSSYLGYKKNEIKYGKGVTKQFDNAIENGNIEWLEEILTEYSDFDINYCGNIMREYMQAGNYQHETLQIVTSYGMLSTEKRQDMLDFLLRKGLDPDLRYSNKSYALEDCCGTVLAETLIKNGANQNIKNDSVLTKIIYDISDCSIDLYINSGAELTSELFERIYNNNTPLNPVAFQYAYKKYIENGGKTSFSKAEEYAVLGENDKLLELLSSEQFNNSQLEVISYFTYCFGNKMIIDALNDKYSNYNLIVPKINTITLIGNTDTFKYLYDNRKNGEYNDEFLFYLAVKKNHKDIIDFLIKKDVPIEKRLASALYESGDMSTVRKICEYMKRKSMLDEHFFYNFECPMTMNAFTKEFIDYLMDELNLSLQQLSLKNTDFLTAKYLFDKGRPLSGTDLENAVYKNDADMVNLVLQKGANPNQPKLANYYSTIYSGSEDSFDRLLVPYDNIINSVEEYITTNNDFDNCWYDAIAYGNSEIVQQIIDSGLELDNDKLLYYAIKYGSFATFNALYQAGASMEYYSDLGQETLVDLAKSMGRDDIVKILKDAGVKVY